MKGRDASIDVVKGLGMLLVFVGHAVEGALKRDDSGYAETLFQYIYAFHMPLFFVVAGLFVSTKEVSFWEFAKKRFFALVIPAAVFVWLMTCLHPFKDWFLHGELNVRDYVMMLFSPLGGFPRANWICWFLFCLFSSSLLFYVVTTYLKWPRWWVLMMLYGVGYLTIRNIWDVAETMRVGGNFWFIHNAPMCCFFMLLGAAFRNFFLTFKERSIAVQLAVAFLCLGALLWTAPMNEGPFLQEKKAVILAVPQVGSVLWFPVNAMLGVMGVFALGGLLKGVKLLAFAGRVSMGLIFFAGLWLTFLNRMSFQWYHGEYVFYFGLLLGLGSFVLAVPMAGLFHRLFPQAVGVYRK